MTTGASLPPPAPKIVSVDESSVDDQKQCNGHGEGDAVHMSPTYSTLQEACSDVHSRVVRFLATEPRDGTERRTQDQSRIALEVIGKALQQYDFDTLSLSYNGGKDCLVLLILYLSALHTHYNKSSNHNSATTNEQPEHHISNAVQFPTSIPSIYAKPTDPFPQVTSFVETSTRAYHLALTHMQTNPGPNPRFKSHTSPPSTTIGLVASNNSNSSVTDTPTTSATITPSTTSTPNDQSETQTPQPIITFRDAFTLYLQAQPNIQAIFVGTRRTDPHGAKLTHFDMTDGKWPRFMRIHPVIDWTLGDIWTFLRHPALADPETGAPLEYCSIYDLGYTSLGGVGDTLRNPKLKYVDEQGNEKYHPAYKMIEDKGERLGREQ